MKSHHIVKLSLSVGLAVFLGWMGFASLNTPAMSKEKSSDTPALVVLSASWCASCREINPVIRRIVETSPELGLKVVTLDVDSGDAPSNASAYGITVAGTDVPQVYLFSNGKTVLLFNGRNYRMGQAKAVESQIRNQLQQTY